MAINLVREAELVEALRERERERERESISLINVESCHLEIPYFVKIEYYKKSRKI